MNSDLYKQDFQECLSMINSEIELLESRISAGVEVLASANKQMTVLKKRLKGALLIKDRLIRGTLHEQKILENDLH